MPGSLPSRTPSPPPSPKDKHSLSSRQGKGKAPTITTTPTTITTLAKTPPSTTGILRPRTEPGQSASEGRMTYGRARTDRRYSRQSPVNRETSRGRPSAQHGHLDPPAAGTSRCESSGTKGSEPTASGSRRQSGSGPGRGSGSSKSSSSSSSSSTHSVDRRQAVARHNARMEGETMRRLRDARQRDEVGRILRDMKKERDKKRKEKGGICVLM